MASDTASAAVPFPGDPSRDTAETPATGGLAGLFAPVAPARTEPLHFDLDPGHDDTADTDLANASSADFGDTTGDSGKTPDGKDSGKEQGIVRAWLLAGAERWRKGADTRNKRLDVQKARAQAFKEARTTTVNRAEKISGGNTGTNTQSKSDKSGPGGQKTSSGSGRGGPGGRSTGPGSGSGSGRGGSGRHGSGGHDTAGKSKDRGHGGSGKDTSSKRTSDGSRSTSAGAKHDPGKSPTKKSGHDSTTAIRNNNPGGAGAKDRKTTTRTCGDDSGISLTKDKKQKAPKNTAGPASTGTQGAGGKTGKDAPTGKTSDTGTGNKAAGPQKNPDSKGGLKTIPETKQHGKTDLRKDDKTTPKTSDPTGKSAKDPKATPGTGKSLTPASGKGGWKGPGLDIRSSRETGYRDGSRLGRVEAHVGAYRDGIRDGRTDIKEAAAREKTRLDKAHTDHKPPTTPPAVQKTTVVPPKPTFPPKPTTPPKVTGPTPVPPPTSRVQAAPDKQKKERPVPQPATRTAPQTAPAAVTPIPVTGIDREKLTLGPGATRRTISRGEVRSLRHFQKILEEQAAEAGKRAERMRVFEQHAIEQAKEVIQLAEQAKAVEGGDRLLGTLARAEEMANGQAAKASRIYKAAVRAHDHITALAANVESRYGEMYKAIINSPETSPAELSYYKDMADA